MKRFEIWDADNDGPQMLEDVEGRFVLFSEVKPLIDEIAELKLMVPMTAEEAEAAFEEAQSIPVSEDQINRMVEFATRSEDGRRGWNAALDKAMSLIVSDGNPEVAIERIMRCKYQDIE